MSFINKTAIVTGAGQGIGFAICQSLLRAGARVVINDVDEKMLGGAVQKLSASSDAYAAVPGNAGSIECINTMVQTAVDRFGSLDIIVANAGITLFGDFFDYGYDEFSKVMALNLGGSFFLAQAAAKQMRLQKSGGSMLLMSSVTGHQAHKNLAAYSMTKAALEMLARNLVIELSPYHITVNAIAPGATLTERTLSDETYTETWSGLTPMGRPATTEDISATAMFLISDSAKHITGQSLVVDGGWTCVSPSPY